MDTVIIESIFGRTLLSKFLKRYIKKHFDISVDISINSLKYRRTDDKFTVDVHVGVNGNNNELLKINRILEGNGDP